jgi:hypothetical protein
MARQGNLIAGSAGPKNTLYISDVYYIHAQPARSFGLSFQIILEAHLVHLLSHNLSYLFSAPCLSFRISSNES